MSTTRDHLVLALDLDDLDHARTLAQPLTPWFSIAKVGYELYAAAGPDTIDALHDDGFAVFLDLKLLDIPTTVEKGARAIGRRGVDFLNFHTIGGLDMLRAGVAGLADGARSAGHTPPVALGVTVLTSEPNADAVPERLELARQSGCDGVVCAAAEATAAATLGLAPMVPGIRLAGGSVNDQARVATPGDAIRAGARWIIAGRAVTAAADPEAVARQIAADVDTARTEPITPAGRESP